MMPTCACDMVTIALMALIGLALTMAIPLTVWELRRQSKLFRLLKDINQGQPGPTSQAHSSRSVES